MSGSVHRGEDIAVVGVSALFPGAVASAPFWNNILAGRDFVGDVPPEHWLIDDYYDPDPRAPGKTYARRGAFLPAVDFDPMQHGLPPKQLSTTDTAQLLSLIVAQKVLDDAASVQFGKVNKRDISVILGVASSTELVGQMVSRIQRPQWTAALRSAGLPESQVQDVCSRIEALYPEWDESTFPGLLGNVVAGRIANRLDLGGTNCVIDAACASSLGAVAMAVQELQLGHSDLVITGGVDTLNDVFMFMCFSKTPALSPTGDCRPFADAADGTMLGEGIGMVALRRLADAERDGDKIYAVMRGVGSSSDGRAKSIYAPRASGQEIAIRRAYERAGYGPEEVGLIEAHGTATKAGDVAEFNGLCRAFADVPRQDKQWCALGSVKSQIGHTKAAAGSASLFKAVMALHHKLLPPTIKVDKPNAKLEIENSPFYLNTRTRPWIQAPGRTRKASVSSFGFGGSNFHVTLEEYVGAHSVAQRYSSLPVHALVLSADSVDALLAHAEAVRTKLQSTPLPNVARELQLTVSAKGTHRLAVVAATAEAAAADLSGAIQSIRQAPTQPLTVPHRLHYAPASMNGKIAFLFPGQGSQYVEMGAALAMEFNAARTVWDETAALSFDDERTLPQVVFPIPVFTDEERQAQSALLTRTEWAQPAIGATSLSMLRLLEQLGVRADGVAGHSYGELCALHAAGALGNTTALLTTSRKRGELMRDAAAVPGAMLAVRASVEQLQALLAEYGVGDVVVANLNSPRQIVVAGPADSIESFARLLTREQLTSQRLPVATAFHTALVADSVAPFAEFLAEVPIEAPRLPVYGNTHAEPYPNDPVRVRQLLAGQLAKPVRFADTIARMHADGYRIFLEVGPGSVLTGMVTDCLQGQPHVAVSMDARKIDGRASLVNALATLFAHGVVVDFEKFWADFAPFDTPVDRSTLSPATVPLNGSNYGKPYPPVNGAAGRPQPNPEKIPAPPHSTPSVAPTAPSPVMTITSSSPVTSSVTSPVTSPVSSPQPVASPQPTPSQPITMDASWSAAFQAMQQQTLEAQKTFTQALSESHQAFLRTSEVAFNQLARASGVSSANGISVSAPALPPTVPPMSTPTPHPVAQTIPAPTPVPTPVQTPVQPPAPVVSVTAPAPVKATSAPAVAPSAPAVDYQALLLAVVAEKTGYPQSMLTLDMELEAGLGIDSIKRVEILSVLQERIPQLAQVDTARLASLNTLREIVDFAAETVAASSATAPAGAAPGATTTATSATVSAPVTPAVDYKALLLSVVAEKTGYPESMLSLDMELEAGLGIDSIKRVEILSVLQERIPQLAQVDTARLATLNTLREIVDFAASAVNGAVNGAAMPGAAATSVPSASTATAAPVAQGTGADTIDYQSLLLSVVADKTGYPVGMLNLDMELEAGLGIDSIKRVEILSVLQERIPQLAQVDTARLASLNTLREIVDFASGTSSGSGEAGVPTVATPDATTTGSTTDSPLERVEVTVRSTPASGVVTPGLFEAAPLYIVASHTPVAALLARQLTDAGVSVSMVQTPPATARAVLLLSALDIDSAAPAAQAELNETVFEHLRTCAATMASAGQLLVTVQTTGGQFGRGEHGAEHPWSSGIVAAARTAALEWPLVTVKAIDLDTTTRDHEALATALCSELLAGGDQREVGLRADGGRYTPTVQRQQRSAVSAMPAPDGVIVVSGGARGVTAACLEALLARGPLTLAVLGRTPLVEEPATLASLRTDAELKQALLAHYQQVGQPVTPQELGAQVRAILAQRELRANLARFSALGARVRYDAVDVSDAHAVDAALDTIRRDLGPIRGLVHAAGVLADKEIKSKTPAQFHRVFDTKVQGFMNLLAATRDDALTHIVCFSSVAAYCGNVGQVDYAMANEVLNQVCREEQRRRGARCLVKSIGWGPWAGGMVDPGLEKHFRAMGVTLIPLAEGARLFADEFSGINGDAPEILFGGGLERFGGTPANSSNGVFHVRFHHSTHPYLASHVIRDVPVVPMVTINDMALHAARAFTGLAHLSTTNNLKVIKGIPLPNFDTVGDRFVLECQRTGDEPLVRVRVLDPLGALHYSVDVPCTVQAAPVLSNSPVPALQPWTPESGVIYDGRLFHGPALQVLEELRGMSDNACAGLLRGRASHALGSVAPVDVLDGGLQLVVLWVHEQAGCEALPTGMGMFHVADNMPHAAPVLCDAVCEQQTSLMTRWTVHYRTPQGEVIGMISDLTLHLLPHAESRRHLSPLAGVEQG